MARPLKKKKKKKNATSLTCHNHHEDGEYLLVVGLRGDVPEANARHARHRVVERRHVHGLPRGPSLNCLGTW